MGKGWNFGQQVMEKALEKAALRHLQYLQNPNYEARWGAPETWDWDDYQAWQGPTHQPLQDPWERAKAGEEQKKAGGDPANADREGTYSGPIHK